MVHDDAQVGNRVGQQHVGLHQVHAGVGGVQCEVGLRQQLQVSDVVLLQRDLAIVCPAVRRVVEPAGADGAIQRVAAKVSDVSAEVRRARVEAPATPTMNGSARQTSRYQRLSSIKLLDSTTIAPTTPTGRASAAVHRGQRRLVQRAIGLRTHVAGEHRAGRVEQMNMRVDDGNGAIHGGAAAGLCAEPMEPASAAPAMEAVARNSRREIAFILYFISRDIAGSRCGAVMVT